MNKSKYSTVIVTDKNSQETQVYSIKQKHIKNINLYKRILLSSIVCIFFVMIGFISYIWYNYTQKKELYVKIVNLEDKLDSDKLKKMVEDLNNAEESLSKIENYLKEREVKVLNSSYNGENTDVGGEYHPIDEINTNLIKVQKERISELLQKLQSVPIGLPHIGRLSSEFGVRGNPFSFKGREFHSGLDIAGNIGAPIKVTANGKISFAGVKGGYGNCIIVKHKYGYETLYAHLSKIKVQNGQKVKSGQIIGLLGNTGRSSGPHVHYEVILNQEKINPKNYLKINN